MFCPAVSQLSWKAIREDYSVQQFERELNRIRKMNLNIQRGL